MKAKPLSVLPHGFVTLALVASLGSAAGAQQPTHWTAEWAKVLQHMSLEMVDDGTGNLVPTIRITGANLQIVNGLGATQTSNSAGNLIVGYNEFGNANGDFRTGSHNISFGEANSFSSFGGLVGPLGNTVSGPFASVSGGFGNTAAGTISCVSGGYRNTASGSFSWVGGGSENVAGALYSSVSGGQGNTAIAYWSCVSGGKDNRALSNDILHTGARVLATPAAGASDL